MQHIEKDCYCKECLQFKTASDFSRHYFIKPLPKKKICNDCTVLHDKPIHKANTAMFASKKLSKKKNAEADQDKVDIRHAIEKYIEDKKSKDYHEL